jgi:hypothetical protein
VSFRTLPVVHVFTAQQERHLAEQRAEMEAKARKAVQLQAALRAKEASGACVHMRAVP